MTSYHTILFDADDTLFDYRKAESQALVRTFEQAGFTVSDQLLSSYKVINQQLWRDLEQGLIHIAELRTERFQRLLDQVRPVTSFSAAELSDVYVSHLSDGFFLIEGAVELCRQLEAKGCKLAIVTNGIREVQLSRIGKSELKDTFGHIIISEDTGYQKPHSGFFDHAFAKLGLADKAGVLIVGDSLTSDIQGGLNYGIATCWYNPRHLRNTAGIKPTYEIHELGELPEIIEQPRNT